MFCCKYKIGFFIWQCLYLRVLAWNNLWHLKSAHLVVPRPWRTNVSEDMSARTLLPPPTRSLCPACQLSSSLGDRIVLSREYHALFWPCECMSMASNETNSCGEMRAESWRVERLLNFESVPSFVVLMDMFMSYLDSVLTKCGASMSTRVFVRHPYSFWETGRFFRLLEFWFGPSRSRIWPLRSRPYPQSF